ncbi:hypothetical protein ACFP3Q_11100 [Nocardioides sp. GCM10027113]|uniref:hypothetical protein n=1 Tax=unclassified Nocardioides TaxID=2615069 RepID=UPI003618E2F5
MAHNSHKRDTDARRFPKAQFIAGPLAFVATASAVGLGVLGSDSSAQDEIIASNSASVYQTEREERQVVTRSASRMDMAEYRDILDEYMEKVATKKAIRKADTKLWTTAPLNLWNDPTKKAKKVGLLEEGKKVLVTGRRTTDRAEVVVDGRSRWVTLGYLSQEKPSAEEPEEAEPAEVEADATCTNGSSVPSGVSPNVVAVHQAVCANFPELTSYGTFRSDGEHSQGIAIDIMVSGERGWQVAEFIKANYQELGVSYLIYSQQIWSVDRAGEGWRWMEDRGSSTANHYDHVHVTTY